MEKKMVDPGKSTGDKAFDCLNHRLLIAKLNT